jgi:hypothetical protein
MDDGVSLRTRDARAACGVPVILLVAASGPWQRAERGEWLERLRGPDDGELSLYKRLHEAVEELLKDRLAGTPA